MHRRGAIVALLALAAVSGANTAIGQQPEKVWRVGYLTLGSIATGKRYRDTFVKAMRDLGYVEGRNLVVEWRFADGKFERLPEYAAELVRLNVDALVAVASGAIGAAQRATRTIPIVMATTGDPVASGFVKSLSRPGGNITGLSSLGGDTGGKLLDVLLSAIGKPSRVAVLVTPTSTTYKLIRDDIQREAHHAGVDTLVLEVSTPDEIDQAFATIAKERVGSVIVGSAPLFSVHNQRIVDLALKYRISSIFGDRMYVETGGLMSYGVDRTINYVRTADYVDRIFKGAKPADLPVEQPALLELVINLATASKLGLAIPQAVLLRANEVIR